MNDRTIIGNAEQVTLPQLGVRDVCVRIDTGAKTSAIWASSVKKTAAGLEVVFFGKGSEYYTGLTHAFTTYSQLLVASSNGAIERRYKIQLVIEIGGRKIRAGFTLADRSTQVYPILVGRNVLRGKFIVDVSVGARAIHTYQARRRSALKKWKKG